MRVIMVMYDSLCRDLLPGYGNHKINLPNFERLTKHSVTFLNNYACSLPCMPARRELHTGRPNFLHRSWGPLEPFDESMPEILHDHGIHSHLSTDHYHYFEDGGATYHNRYCTWAGFRGQENDAWIGECVTPRVQYANILMNHDHQPEPLRSGRIKSGWQNVINRLSRNGEADYSQTLTFDNGIDFIKRNLAGSDWYLQIEAFDPHEPFDSPDRFSQNWFPSEQHFTMDWPPYAQVSETDEEIEMMKRKYYALLQYCDYNLGRILDILDENNMWADTMLIVNTDHGFSLAEHGWWGKNYPPDYQEVVHIPLFIWDPRYGIMDETRSELVQTIDIAPTVLDFMNLPIPDSMLGKPLGDVLRSNKRIREYGIFGMFGSAVNITDGRYVYMRAVRHPENALIEHTLLPLRMNGYFSAKELQYAELSCDYSFLKGYRILKIPCMARRGADKLKCDMLFDLWEDSEQLNPIKDPVIEARMLAALRQLFLENEAPGCLYDRFCLID